MAYRAKTSLTVELIGPKPRLKFIRYFHLFHNVLSFMGAGFATVFVIRHVVP